MPRRTARRHAAQSAPKQVNFRVDRPLYDALGAIARQEGRTLAQAARRLMEESLKRRTHPGSVEDLRAEHVAVLAEAGGAFDWLADEPDLYDEESGEPV